MKDQTKQVKSKFLQDTANHSMEILLDQGTHRHLKFSNNGSSIYRFDLITWPGYLCVCGDMGEFVFSRLPDMFRFFRADDRNLLEINPSYWAEKCLACGREGIEKYDPDVFREAIKEWIEDWTDEAKEEALSELMDCADEGECYARRAVDDFEFDGHRFQDFWEVDLTSYTWHYLWICHAIVWGIDKYDLIKNGSVK